MGLRCLSGMEVTSLFLIVRLKRKLSPIPWMGEGTMLLMLRRIKEGKEGTVVEA